MALLLILNSPVAASLGIGMTFSGTPLPDFDEPRAGGTPMNHVGLVHDADPDPLIPTSSQVYKAGTGSSRRLTLSGLPAHLRGQGDVLSSHMSSISSHEVADHTFGQSSGDAHHTVLLTELHGNRSSDRSQTMTHASNEASNSAGPDEHLGMTGILRDAGTPTISYQ